MSSPAVQAPAVAATTRRKVVIIGSGFGGLFAAQRLAKSDVDVTLIAKTTHHLFQPMLYQVATGIVAEGEIAPATRMVLRKQKNTAVLMGDVTDIDLEAKTVTSRLLERITITPYDDLIVAAGADQSYFGNDHFAEFAPGMKTIDHALELRGRILGAFEQAELSHDPAERAKLLTFVVVGAGPTGVELAGQIAEMSDKTLKGAFRNIDPTEARVILLDAAPAVLPPFGPKLGAKAATRLERMGVEVQLNAMVVDVDYDGLVVKEKDGTTRRIESQCKVWSAGVQGSPLGRQLADQSGVELDRAGRVKVLPDLTIPGHPEVFVVGDMMAVDGVPGVAQGAIQGGRYAADAIKAELKGQTPDQRKPFSYYDKGSMATISRYSAVMQVPIPGTKKMFETEGYFAWLGWLALHLVYLVGFRNRLNTLINWFFAFTTRGRSQLAVTEQQVYARTAIGQLSAMEKAGSESEPAKRDAGTGDSGSTASTTTGSVPTEGKDADGKESAAEAS
ncbi:NAD(P)/FAD-dependent oxidoreductase [Gordonia sp. zg691]|uniref:NADH:ubiquinone reductase (non-electrogenic) n=1 Tax=Gordonia jinghuaiqii TaxID=2758710 RepID=A0A7D7R0U1_9ACTN|nr:NAD(P)/FAD-dependent oxidoreductase [Gordonia jinghuaiqii]MBD0862676.1 NAD(P)/FAD-dependent oxidoreductase [Gordonia jinghuaiqii]MCR5976758.1 NAD(P)/FAD-dependent oxidoreductase [Gordonia jinghuaiqii]QMS99931.1 NAD(P)/FAD-dependent oxidoreductase [Gordonia jinghuaiqii]